MTLRAGLSQSAVSNDPELLAIDTEVRCGFYIGGYECPEFRIHIRSRRI